MSDDGQTSKASSEKKGNAFKIVAVIFMVLILVAAGVIIYLLTRPEPEPEVPNRGTVLTEDNVSDELEGFNEPVEDGYYEASQTIEWNFDGTKSTDAYVTNKTTNTRTVYFDLKLEDTGEMLYSSPYIPVGSELKGVEMDHQIEPGTYDAVVTYHLVDDNEQEVSTVNVGIIINVR